MKVSFAGLVVALDRELVFIRALRQPDLEILHRAERLARFGIG